MEAEVGVTEAPSLDVALGVATAAVSELSGKLTAQESVTFALPTPNEIQYQVISTHKQSSPLYLTSKATLLLHVFGAVCYGRGPGRQECGDTGRLLLLLL